MKRIISSFIAAVMVVAAMSTTAFAADYTVTLSLDYEDAVSEATLKAGDVFNVYARLDNNVGIASKNLQIAYDPTVLAPIADAETEADEEEVEPSVAHVPYAYFVDYDDAKKGAKWGDIIIGEGDVDGDKKYVSFVGARDSATTTKKEDMLIGGVHFEVLDDSVESTDVYISEFAITSDGSTVLPVDITSKVTIKFESVQKTPAKATVVDMDNNFAANKVAYTQGYKVEVVGNDETVTGLNFTFTLDGNTSEEKTAFTGLNITGTTPSYLGLNVINVPASIEADTMVANPIIVK